MLLGFLDAHTIYVTAHLIGVVIGAGGAYTSDLMFISSIKDEKISNTEIRFMKLGSKMVWVGLIIIIISGALLFSENTKLYLDSTKFLAKMTIIGILIANGIFFHLSHIPRLHRHIGTHLPSSDEFVRKSNLLIASGVVSIISWTSALVLGSIKSIPYSYATIMTFYLAILALGIGGAMLMRKKIISTEHKRNQ